MNGYRPKHDGDILLGSAENPGRARGCAPRPCEPTCKPKLFCSRSFSRKPVTMRLNSLISFAGIHPLVAAATSTSKAAFRERLRPQRVTDEPGSAHRSADEHGRAKSESNSDGADEKGRTIAD